MTEIWRPRFLYAPDPPAGPPVEDPGADDPPAGDPPAPPTGTAFTQEQLDAAIGARLAQEKRKWEKESKDATDKANMTENERLKAEIAERDKRLADQQTEVVGDRVRSKAEKLALAAKVKPGRIDQFMRLVDIDVEAMAPDGKPSDMLIQAAIDKAVKDLPEFVDNGTGAPPPAGAGGASGADFNSDKGASHVFTKAEVAAMSVADFEKNEEAINKQMQSIGIR